MFLCLIELRHQCCGTSASDICESEGDKGKEACFGQWVLFPEHLGGKVESDYDVLSVVVEES